MSFKSHADYQHLNILQMNDIKRAHKAGKTVRQLAIKYGVKESTVKKCLVRGEQVPFGVRSVLVTDFIPFDAGLEMQGR